MRHTRVHRISARRYPLRPSLMLLTLTAVLLLATEKSWSQLEYEFLEDFPLLSQFDDPANGYQVRTMSEGGWVVLWKPQIPGGLDEIRLWHPNHGLFNIQDMQIVFLRHGIRGPCLFFGRPIQPQEGGIWKLDPITSDLTRIVSVNLSLHWFRPNPLAYHHDSAFVGFPDPPLPSGALSQSCDWQWRCHLGQKSVCSRSGKSTLLGARRNCMVSSSFGSRHEWFRNIGSRS